MVALTLSEANFSESIYHNLEDKIDSVLKSLSIKKLIVDISPGFNMTVAKCAMNLGITLSPILLYPYRTYVTDNEYSELYTKITKKYLSQFIIYNSQLEAIDDQYSKYKTLLDKFISSSPYLVTYVNEEISSFSQERYLIYTHMGYKTYNMRGIDNEKLKRK